MVRAKTKTEVATIKLTPQCRLAWEAAAASQTRSLSNMFEVAILDYCKRYSIDIPAAPAASQSLAAPLPRAAAPPAKVVKPATRKNPRVQGK